MPFSAEQKSFAVQWHATPSSLTASPLTGSSRVKGPSRFYTCALLLAACDSGLLNQAWAAWLTQRRPDQRPWQTGSRMHMQDAVLFRKANLSRLAAAGVVPWMPPVDTLQSYMALVATPFAATSSKHPAAAWAPLLMLVPPDEAILALSIKLQAIVFSAVLDGATGDVKKRHRVPPITRLCRSVGRSIMQHARAQVCVQLRASLHITNSTRDEARTRRGCCSHRGAQAKKTGSLLCAGECAA